MWPFRRAASGSTAGLKASAIGCRGERLARNFLKKQGLKILAMNYRCPVGEADLIVLDKTTKRCLGSETLVFVEVKTRSSDRYTDPESAVDVRKRQRLRKVAACYMATRDVRDIPVRFDVVSVLFGGGPEPEIRHIPDAF